LDPAQTPSQPPTQAATTEPDGTLPAPELKALKFAMTLGEPTQFAPMLAQRLGLFAKYGIAVDITVFNAGNDVTQALLSGQVDMGGTDAAGALNSQSTDSPLKMIEIFKLRPSDGLFCGEPIRSAADVKGKLVGGAARGGPAYASVVFALEELGLTENDVVYQVVGVQNVRLTALKSGAIACAPVSIDLKTELEGLGLNLLVDLSTADLQYPSSGITAPARFLAERPNTALVIAAAILEAQNYMWTNPAEAATHWADYAQIDLAAAQPLISALHAQGNRTGLWDDSAFVAVQRIVAVNNPAIMGVDVTKAYDRSLLEKLQDTGFYKKIGLPVP
jgi:NitT/TauT family transport system substrate-binding protein